MQCPDCAGTGTIIADHVSYADGRHGFGVPMKCLTCHGTMQVDDRYPEWRRLGQRLRDWRVKGPHGYRTLLAEAQRRGLTMSELSEMEWGRVEPVMPEEME